MGEPIGVVDWTADDAEWLAARRLGMGGSDISAVLGFSIYTSPWEVWADKTGVKTWDDGTSDAAELGTALEPWLRDQAGRLLGESVKTTEYRTYSHADHSERLCSPDGIIPDGRLLECKTAGLASGFGAPRGWDAGAIPLGYEFQCRWSMYVMDAPAVELVALVAGMGLIHRTITRDADTEAAMVRQVAAWWERYVIRDVEPPLGARDAELMQLLYPRSDASSIDLDGSNAIEHWGTYHSAHARQKRAEEEKATAAAELQRLIGEAERGLVGEECIATWTTRKGRVDYPALLADLKESGMEIPDLETYRKPSTRTFTVKDMT